MLYDPRWERRLPEPPGGRRGTVFALLLAAAIPVFIAAYTIAVSLDEILVLIVPVALNAAGIALARPTRSRSRPGRPFAR